MTKASRVELCSLAVSNAGAFVAWVRQNRDKVNKADLAMILRKGTAKYIRAIATGDTVDDETYRKRSAVCQRCPAATKWSPENTGPFALYCGKPFEETAYGPDGDGPTCGCDTEAKALVGSEACPRRHWGASGQDSP